MANAGIERRVDVQIPSASGDLMCGWLYSSQHFTASKPGPAIVLAHGLGATKELKLDVYADEFNRMGYTCLVFDYRCSGGSPGLPRGLIDWSQQQEDWKFAIKYARLLENVDPEQVGLFGTSFSGGHVIQLAAGDKRLKAVISQCPFTDGWKSSLCTGITTIPKLAVFGLLDSVFGTDNSPVTVSLLGKPGEGKFKYRGSISCPKLICFNSCSYECTGRAHRLRPTRPARTQDTRQNSCSFDIKDASSKAWLLRGRYPMPYPFWHLWERFRRACRCHIGICQESP